MIAKGQCSEGMKETHLKYVLDVLSSREWDKDEDEDENEDKDEDKNTEEEKEKKEEKEKEKKKEKEKEKEKENEKENKNEKKKKKEKERKSVNDEIVDIGLDILVMIAMEYYRIEDVGDLDNRNESRIRRKEEEKEKEEKEYEEYEEYEDVMKRMDGYNKLFNVLESCEKIINKEKICIILGRLGFRLGDRKEKEKIIKIVGNGLKEKARSINMSGDMNEKNTTHMKNIRKAVRWIWYNDEGMREFLKKNDIIPDLFSSI
jgi:hypothetical protein